MFRILTIDQDTVDWVILTPESMANMTLTMIANDVPICGGDCVATGNPKFLSIPAAVVESSTKMDKTECAAYIQRNTVMVPIFTTTPRVHTKSSMSFWANKALRRPD